MPNFNMQTPPKGDQRLDGGTAAGGKPRPCASISRRRRPAWPGRWRERRAELWQAENREAIESSNAYVEKHGLPLENSGPLMAR